MSTVADVLRSKGREIYSINAERSVYEAVEQMVACDVAALVVTDDQSELAGIISQRDFANKVVLCDRSPKAVKVKEVIKIDNEYQINDVKHVQFTVNCCRRSTGNIFFFQL